MSAEIVKCPVCWDKKSGDKMQAFSTGATRGKDEGKLDYEGFLSPFVLTRYAQYLNEHRIDADGNTRESDNWQKGMPRHKYMKSILRHLFDAWKLWRQGACNMNTSNKLFEDLLCAVLFNIMGLLHEILVGRDVRE